MEYPKVCAHCKCCMNDPYGNWYCVDNKGKVVREIMETSKETCKKWKLSDICRRFLASQDK